MAAQTRTPRERWIDEGLRALASGGPDAVRVESLAKTLGVTKGGFYWHFRDRNSLFGEMLDRWEHVMVDAVIEQVESKGGGAAARLRRLFGLGASVDELLGIELAIRDWARRDDTVAARVLRVDNKRMDYMRGLFGELHPDPVDVEMRCFVVLAMFVGNRHVAAEHGRRSRSAVMKDVMRWVME